MVSIIIPIYNVAPYVEQCLQSVMHQTMTAGVECILVDDCGQDNSMELVEQMLAREGYSVCTDGTLTSNHSPLIFRILHHEHNRGLSAARNAGIEAARGEYLYFLDSDDYITESCIEHLWTLALKYPGVDFVQAGIWSDEEVMNRWLHRPTERYHVPAYCNDRKRSRQLLQSLYYNQMAQNRLLNRDFLIRHKLYFQKGLLHEDDLWTIQMGKHIQSIAYTPVETYYYRYNPHGITSVLTEKRYQSICTIADTVLHHLPRFEGFKYELGYTLNLLKDTQRKWQRYPLPEINQGSNFLFRMLYRYYSYGNLSFVGRKVSVFYHLYHIFHILSHPV